MLSNKASNTGIGLHLIKLLATGVFRNHQITEIVACTIDCYNKLSARPQWLKTTHTQLTEHGKVAEAYIEHMWEGLAFPP